MSDVGAEMLEEATSTRLRLLLEAAASFLESGTLVTKNSHLGYCVKFCSAVGIKVDQFVCLGVSGAEAVL